MPKCLLSLGSNRGDARATLAAATDELRRLSDRGELIASHAVDSTPVGGPSGQGRYVNGAVLLDTSLGPMELLDAVLRLEERFDRQRTTRWAARTLDIDLLLYEQRVIAEPRLRVPHPRMSFRPFVLDPACEIAADWIHPEIGLPIADLGRRIRDGGDFVGMIGVEDAVAERIVAKRSDVRLRSFDGSTADGRISPPKLTIVGGDPRATSPPAGPRLVLNDCPREHWDEEIAAALECVWPTSP